MNISVVIPTYNRRMHLLQLLQCLVQSALQPVEVIIVDASEQPLLPADYADTFGLPIKYMQAKPSVCAQRNAGIAAATGEWIFVCDDDMEVPADYLSVLCDYAMQHPEAVALSGNILQQEAGQWVDMYPLVSRKELWLKYIFGLSTWGEIRCKSGWGSNRLQRYYARKGNHIAASGWPVLTDFSGAAFITPVFGLGASLIKKEWLLRSAYDETLGQHGIGDNYGVSIGLPGIHVVKAAFVYHHHAPANRLKASQQYYNRVMALGYFIRTRQELRSVSRLAFTWSLLGNFFIFSAARNWAMARTAFRALHHTLKNKQAWSLS